MDDPVDGDVPGRSNLRRFSVIAPGCMIGHSPPRWRLENSCMLGVILGQTELALLPDQSISFLRRQATRWASVRPAQGSSKGRSVRHGAVAKGQRGWNGQPGGGLAGEGTSPGRRMDWLRRGPPAFGMAAIKALV